MTATRITAWGVTSVVLFGLLVSVEAVPPFEKKILDVRQMSVKARAEFGESLIFGTVGASRKEFAVGRAQCSLCHAFFKEQEMADPDEYPSPPWGPHFINFIERFNQRIASPDYKRRHREAFPGSGSASSVSEYLAESNVCASCYVVPGFGVKGSNDRESPMPDVHKAPISLSLDEMIAVDTWLYVHGGKEAPSPDEIEKAYRKFIPASESK